MRFTIWATAAALLVAGSPARTQTTAGAAAFDFTKPGDFIRVLQKAGYRAELKKGKDGKPYVSSAANGNDFSIYFYECDALSLVCKSFEFYSWWKKEPHFSPEFANKWNASKRFMKVAIDEDGDLEQRLYATGIGMTEPNFLELVDWYESMDAALTTFLKDNKPADAKK